MTDKTMDTLKIGVDIYASEITLTITADEAREILSALSESAENKGDLISRQAVLDELEKWDWQELYLPIHFKQILDDVPSVDNKGEWIATENEEMEIDGYFCSKCDLPMSTDEKTPFCPFCGADMRGKDSCYRGTVHVDDMGRYDPYTDSFVRGD